MNTHRESGVRFMSPVSPPNIRFPKTTSYVYVCVCVCVSVSVCVCVVCVCVHKCVYMHVSLILNNYAG